MAPPPADFVWLNHAARCSIAKCSIPKCSIPGCPSPSVTLENIRREHPQGEPATFHALRNLYHSNVSCNHRSHVEHFQISTITFSGAQSASSSRITGRWEASCLPAQEGNSCGLPCSDLLWACTLNRIDVVRLAVQSAHHPARRC